MERVKNLLSKEKRIHAVHPKSRIIDAVYVMTSKHHSCILVKEDNNLAGILTEKDLKDRVIARGIDPEAETISTVMTRCVETIDVEDDLAQCMEVMKKNNCHHVPVTCDNEIIAVVSMKTVMKRIMQNIEDEREMLRQYISG